jgi:hypothetical protein
MDFTLNTYKRLLETALAKDYQFQTVESYIRQPLKRVVVLRHDSDIWPKNDLNMAKVEHELGIKSTYYFRVPETARPAIMKEIVALNHEIGYHYEDLVRTKGELNEAVQSFEKNLHFLKQFYPIQTFSRHGRPLSKIESLDMWKTVNYKEKFGLLAEPYLDIDYSNVLYLTDNGSKWNAHESNIRDVVTNSNISLDVSTTFDLIEAFEKGLTPDVVILNCHPARWNNNPIIWTYRFFLQKAKNVAKKQLKNLRS